VRWTLLTLALLASVGCRAPRDTRPWLHDAYGPSSSPALDLPELRRPDVVAEDGKTRLTVVGPAKKKYGVRWDSVSSSVGAPNDGSLDRGAVLPKEGPGFVHVGKSVFGTDETVTFIQLAAYAVHDADPSGPPLLVGDLSRDGGGHLSPHKSHRSGRDVDVGLYAADRRPLKRFKALSPRDLDADRTWAFIDVLLRTGAVEYVFVDRGLHRALYDAAERAGWSTASLDKLFEGMSEGRGSIIRHVAGHADHLHVRFRCPTDDVECRN
jgi:murein endopeptidase